MDRKRKLQLIFASDCIIAFFSLLIILLCDWPLEALGIAGIFLASTTSLQMIYTLERGKRKGTYHCRVCGTNFDILPATKGTFDWAKDTLFSTKEITCPRCGSQDVEWRGE